MLMIRPLSVCYLQLMMVIIKMMSSHVSLRINSEQQKISDWVTVTKIVSMLKDQIHDFSQLSKSDSKWRYRGRAIELKFFSLIPDRFVSGHSVCWRLDSRDPGFKSCMQQRKTTCLLLIKKITCLGLSIKINNNKHVWLFADAIDTYYVCQNDQHSWPCALPPGGLYVSSQAWP